MVITIIVDTITYMLNNQILPGFAVYLSLISFILTTVAAVVFGQQVQTLKKTIAKMLPPAK
jgi:hypothetical protein